MPPTVSSGMWLTGMHFVTSSFAELIESCFVLTQQHNSYDEKHRYVLDLLLFESSALENDSDWAAIKGWLGCELIVLWSSVLCIRRMKNIHQSINNQSINQSCSEVLVFCVKSQRQVDVMRFHLSALLIIKRRTDRLRSSNFSRCSTKE